jgi:bacillithiol system protein YtxJ
MDWLILNQSNQLEDLVQLSYTQALIIYKHSTRCHISSFVEARLRSEWPEDLHIKAYYLDILAYRSISNAIVEKFAVEHQSPQLLLIKDGRCVYNASHSDIQVEALFRQVHKLKSPQ